MFRFPPLTPLVRGYLIALGALFVTTAILGNVLHLPVLALLALDTSQLSLLTPLQVPTHVWVVPPQPDNVLSLLLSMLFIWLILAPFEQRYGKRRVIELTIVAIVSSALPALLAAQLFPSSAIVLTGPQSITLTAICAYAALMPPHAETNFFGVLHFQAKYLLPIVIGFTVVMFLTHLNAVLLASSLGAIAGGVAYVKFWMQRPGPRGKSRKQGKFRVVQGGEGPPPKQWMN